MKLYLQSTKPGKEDTRFEVLKYDAETKKGIVVGSMGVEFETEMSKETLLKYGYKVVKVEE
ncbi:MAG: hypothetical protein ACYC36_02585 [Bellilinea sp.]